MQLRKILFVDDDEDIRVLSQLSLSAEKELEVILASSGPEALLTARRELPDVILLDVMMPEMDGPTTLARLREQPETEHIPVIFLTATASTRENQRLQALGAAGVIEKPFSPLQLPRRIRGILWGNKGAEAR